MRTTLLATLIPALVGTLMALAYTPSQACGTKHEAIGPATKPAASASSSDQYDEAPRPKCGGLILEPQTPAKAPAKTPAKEAIKQAGKAVMPTKP